MLRIQVESKLKEGSCFTLSLPFIVGNEGVIKKIHRLPHKQRQLKRVF